MKKRAGTWKIASIRGVDLKVHISLVLLLAYVVFMASVQLPFVAVQTGIDPDYLSFAPWIWGVFLSLGLLLSVALHEFGHVFVAQAQGIKVRGVTLMMLGGVSDMEKIPERPYAEFKLSIIGPIVSLALGALLLFIRSRASSPDLAFYTFWLGTANLTLGVFNLLPAFPLDGGRALRSFLAVRRGTLKATQTAVAISKGLAWALGLWGFITFNVLLILIAFFIHAVAQAELVMLTTRRLVEGLKVFEVVERVPPIDERSTLEDAAEVMVRTKTTVLPVTSLSGTPSLVTLERLRTFSHADWSQILVREASEEAAQTLSLNDPISPIIPELLSAPGRALPVKQGDQIVGVLHYSDLDQVMQFKSLQEPSSPESPPRFRNRSGPRSDSAPHPA